MCMYVFPGGSLIDFYFVDNQFLVMIVPSILLDFSGQVFGSGLSNFDEDV